MTTLAPDNLWALAADIENVPDLPSAVNSGIVGDLSHARSGGYHISIEDQPADNYSVVRPNDKAPPGNWPRNLAAAIDTSMSTADMVKAWNRVYAVWANAGDPRRKYWNAFNGWNGIGEAERLDFVAGTRSIASSDHKWHCHDETPRRWVNDPEARRAKASVYRGETLAQYLGQGNGTEGEKSMGVLVKFLPNSVDNGTWFADGTNRYKLTASQVTGKQQLHAAGLLPLGNSGNVYVIQAVPTTQTQADDLLDGWGKEYPAAVTAAVTLSQEQIDTIADAAAAAVVERDDNPLTAADAPVIVEAVKTALREGTATA